MGDEVQEKKEEEVIHCVQEEAREEHGDEQEKLCALWFVWKNG